MNLPLSCVVTGQTRRRSGIHRLVWVTKATSGAPTWQRRYEIPAFSHTGQLLNSCRGRANAAREPMTLPSAGPDAGPMTLTSTITVPISQRSGQTVLHFLAGGISLPVRLSNRLWIADKVRQVLQAAPRPR